MVRPTFFMPCNLHAVCYDASSSPQTAVHFAAKYGQHIVLRQLLEYPKSDMYQRDLVGKTPLDYAIKSLDPALEAKLGALLISSIGMWNCCDCYQCVCR